jgi:DnaJ-class molecular chaperone
MNADLTQTEPCPRCRGTGSGIYNALSPKSTCEVCNGSGLRDAPHPVTLASTAAVAVAVAPGARR